MTLARAFAAELERALQRRQVDVGVTAFRRGSPSEAFECPEDAGIAAPVQWPRPAER
jgi:hypothetical protein